MQACGVAINAFLNLTIDGVPQVWNSANSNLIKAVEDLTSVYPNGDHSIWLMAGDTINYNHTIGAFAQIELLLPPGVFNTPALVPVPMIAIIEDTLLFNGYEPLDSSFRATITSFGQVGQFVNGNFKGKFTNEFATIR